MSEDLGGGTRAIDPLENDLLAALPEQEFDRIRPSLEPVRLPRPTELERANERIEFVYFPTSGVASIVALDVGGETVDTAMIGREGMTGLSVFLGTGQSPMQTIVQVPLTAVRLPAQVLRDELGRNGMLEQLLQRHTQVVMVTMGQLILCNRTHRLDQRAARWLLQVDERIEKAPFGVTQDFLAEMIGVQRPALSVAMAPVQGRRPRQLLSGADHHRRPRRPACEIVRLHQGHRRRSDSAARYAQARGCGQLMGATAKM